MIPEKGKTYWIDFFDPDEEDLSYEGPSTYLGETEPSAEGDETLYRFRHSDNILSALFSEEDIVREI